MDEMTHRATPYHETVDDLRRDLASEAATFHERVKPHRDVVFALQNAEHAGRPHEEIPEAARDAYIGCLMAGNYAYTLAAVLQAAGEKFGQEVAEGLACIADTVLENGDDDGRNADVRPKAEASNA